MSSAVVVRNASKRFNAGKPNEVDALVDIDVSIHRGDFVSLIGPSGCGKSTLLRLIANLIEPTAGTVLVNGKSAAQSRLDQDYGMAFQQSGLFEWRTVRKNIELPLELKGWEKAKRRKRADEMLDLVQLADFGSHLPWQLSGGMQQRVAIARALASHPPLLLMDEPFGALDEMTREHMQAELLRICAAAETTVVFVTHSIPEAVYLSNRVVVMSPRPGVAGVVLFGGWELLLAILSPEGFVLPRPSAIVGALFDNWSEVFGAARVTGFVIITGLIGGVLLGVAVAGVVTLFRTADEALTPVAVAINSIPIIALAPIFNNWFGLTSPRSNQMIVIVLVFFPVFINTTRGLTQIDRSQIELMESYAASKWTILREVRVPNALPYFFTALKLASSLAVIAAIVAEYFGGRQDALGPLITSSAGLARYDDAWAAVLAGTVIGGALYVLASVAERFAMPWLHSGAHATK
jgi:NitT/TauT family transport system ATP-binding protein